MLVAFLAFGSCSKSVAEIDTLQTNLWQTNIENSFGRSLNLTKSAGTADIELMSCGYGQGYISIQWAGSSYRVMIPSGGYQETGADRHRFDD